MLKVMVPVFAIVCAACTSRAPAPTPAPESAGPLTSETRLRVALRDEPESRKQLEAVRTLEASIGRERVDELLGAAARDTTAEWMVRANALLLLGRRHALQHVDAFEVGLRATDSRIRTAAAVGLGSIINIAERRALALLERALRDPDANVQSRALQSLADNSAPFVRQYLREKRDSNLRAIATELLRVAEERGAPLEPRADGSFARAGPDGRELSFRPTTRWPEWDAAVGDLYLSAPGGQPVRVAGDVEVVAAVVPAFFSSDGRYLVYESARRIVVRDLAGGQERVIGPGIAPRILPFTADFVFLRPDPAFRGAASPRESELQYEVWRLAFEGGQPVRVGVLTATTRFALKGNYSPVRWMRVKEREGVFTLEGDDVRTFQLPDPFSSARATP